MPAQVRHCSCLKRVRPRCRAKANLTFNDVKDLIRAEVELQLRVLLPENCQVLQEIEDVMRNNLDLTMVAIALDPFGCMPWTQAAVEKGIEDIAEDIVNGFKGWILECEGRVLERLPRVLECFFDREGNDVFVSFPTFCNPATALLATRLKEAYDSFKELVEEKWTSPLQKQNSNRCSWQF